MSDFDEKDIVPETKAASSGSDFDEADVVADEPEYKAPSEASLSELAKTGAGTVIGGGLGYAGGKLGAGVVEKALPHLGELNKAQVDLISSDPKKYRAAEALESVLDQWKNIGQKTQQTGINAASNARKALEGLPNVPADQIFQALSQEPSNPKYSTPIDPGTKSRLFQEHYNKVQPDIDELRGRKGEIEKRLAELEAGVPVTEDPAIALREKQLNQTYDRKMASPKNVDQSQINFNRNQAQEKLDLSKAKKEQSALEKLAKEKDKLLSEKQAALDGIGGKSKSAIENARKEYAKIANIPEELDLEDRFLRPEYSQQVQNTVDKIRPAKNVGVEPQTLDQMLQEIREGINYDGQSSQVKDFNKGQAKSVRELLGQISPTYDEGMEKSHNLQNLQDKIETSTGVKFDKSPEDIRFADNARTNVGKTLLSGTAGDPAFKNSREELQGIVGELLNQGIIDKNTAENFIKNGELSALKDFVKNSNTKLNLGDAADMVNPSSWLSKIAKLGTKGQAAVAERLPTIKSGLPKLGTVGGALLGGTIGAMAADEHTGASDFIPGLDQAGPAGNAHDDFEMIKENQARQNYDASPAHQDRINYLRNAVEQAPEGFRNGAAYRQAQDELKKLEGGSKSSSALTTASAALNKASPDQLMELSQSFQNIKGADKFVAPLENAAQSGSDEERKARLFGLYQQPAFRQLLKKGSGSQS